MNVLLIDDSVRDYQVFVDSVNENTIPFVYGPTTTRFRFRRFLKDLQVNRIAIVFEIGDLLLGESFFDSADYLNSLNIPHLDFLACNTLQFEEWKDFYAKLTSIVGASNNPTGNLQYGGDWLLESTSEDIEKIYFTKSIEYYKYLLEDYHGFAFIKNNTIYASGGNSYGQVCIGTTSTYVSTSTDVTNAVNSSTGLPYNTTDFRNRIPKWVSIDTYTFFVIMADGTLWGAGYNRNWGLGLNNNSAYTTFQNITAANSFGNSVPIYIRNNYQYTVILMDDGTLWGSGNLAFSPNTPGNEVKFFKNITTYQSADFQLRKPVYIHATAGYTSYMMVVMKDGTLWGGGDNDSGQLGTGNVTKYITFQNVSALNNFGTRKVIDVHLNRNSGTLILFDDGTIWCSGINNSLIISTTQPNTATYTTFQNITTYQSAGFQLKKAIKVHTDYRTTAVLMSDKSIWIQGNTGTGIHFTDANKDVFNLIRTQSASFISKKPVHFYFIDNVWVILMSDGSLWGAGVDYEGARAVLGVGTATISTNFAQIQTGVTAISKAYTYSPLSITAITPSTGSTNTIITITGTNMNNVYKVLFNGISATPTNQTDFDLTVNAPVNTGKVTVTIVDNTKSIVTSPTLFTYVNANQPVTTTTLTNFNSGTSDIQPYFKNSPQLVTFKAGVTCQSQSMVNTLSIYKKNISLMMDGSPTGDTVITFGNRTKRVGWVACGHGTNTLAYSYNGLTWTGLGATIFTSSGLATGWNGTIWSAGGSGTNSLAYSYDGINWTGLGSTIFTDFCHGLLWNQTMCVAVGMATNSIAYSYDGLNWTGLGNSILTNGYSVGWNGHMWIVTGYSESLVNKSMAYSYDGINWTNVPNFYTKISNGLAVAWNGTMWVAGGSGTNSLAYSYNGFDWTGINSNATISQVRGIAWNGTLWVAVGDGTYTNTIAYSYDGKIWTGVTNSNTLTAAWAAGVSWNGKMFIMTGFPPNTLLYSYDGIHWIGLGASVITNYSRAICHSNRYENSIVVKRRRIVAGGNGTNTLAYSTDGISWTGLGTTLFQTACWGIAYNGRIWVAVGSGNVKIGWSLDGQTWYPVETNLYEYGLCIAWNGKMWVSGGSGTNTILYSYDALQWFATTNSKALMVTSVFSIDWNGTVWVAAGQGSTSLAYSYDGISWTATTNLFSTNGIKVVWNGKLFLAAGYGTNNLAYSYDGINNWTPVSSTINGHGLAWNGTMWITSDGAYSYDAIQWTSRTSPIPNGMYIIWTGTLWLQLGFPANTMMYSYDGIKWNGLGRTIFSDYGICACSDLMNEYTNTAITIQTPVVALGQGTNTIAYSNDGIQWIGLGATIFNAGYAIAYDGSRWVAGGTGGNTLAYSDDGLTWKGLGSTIFITGCYEIAYNGTIWVAVGQGTNTIAYSYDRITWTPYSNNLFTIANSVAWNGTTWIAGGNGNVKLASSSDGKTWNGLIQYTGIGVVIGIEYNGSMWVAGGEAQTLNYALNGLAWSTGITWSSGITWSDGISSATSLQVTTIETVTLVYSYNGITWYPNKNLLLNSVQSLAWNGKMWIAVGGGNSYSIIYSYDGINWTGVPNSLTLFPSAALGIIWNGLRWIAAGAGTNTLAYSNDGIVWVGLGNSIMTSGYGIGPRILDPKLDSGDDNIRFSTESYSQTGYSNMTVCISNTYN